MYSLTHEGELVGNCKLERGDPSIRAVSGVFHNMGGSKALASWIQSIGGSEDEGVVFITLNKDFSLCDQEGNVFQFQEGSLISVPGDDEAYLDITGLSEDVYKTYFSEHIKAIDV